MGPSFYNSKVLKSIILVWVGLTLARSEMTMMEIHSEIQKRRKKERATMYYSKRRHNLSVASVTMFHRNADFECYLRMRRSTFDKLLVLVRDKFQKNERIGEVAGRPTIPPDLRLAIFLRMMAGGCADDIATTYDVSRDACYKVFDDTRKALDEVLVWPGIPTNYDDLKKMADDFQVSRYPANPLPGCIGALDGISIEIIKPSEEDFPASYWCRKGYYALPVQAMCDEHYRFRCFSATCCDSTHDSLAHAVSSLGKYLEEGNLAIEFWIAGDEAYVCSIFIITPVPGTQANDEEDSFNFYQSSSRMHIEQAFGMLMRKWPILKKLNFSVMKSTEVIEIAMKLHNFCIDHNGAATTRSTATPEQEQTVEESRQWYSAGKHAYVDQVNQQNSSAKRDHLIEIIKNGGFQRPPIRTVRIPDYIDIRAG